MNFPLGQNYPNMFKAFGQWNQNSLIMSDDIVEAVFYYQSARCTCQKTFGPEQIGCVANDAPLNFQLSSPDFHKCISTSSRLTIQKPSS